MSDHLIEIMIVLSNFILAVATLLAFVATFYGMEKEHRIEMLAALHLAARQRVVHHSRRFRRTVRTRARKAFPIVVKSDDSERDAA
jgi:hypothetical protein